MRRNSIILQIVISSLILTSCIKSYEPVIESKDAVKYVVSGQVVKGDTVQHIKVSLTSPINNPSYIGVSGCQILVSDDKGNSYETADLNNGNYSFIIPENHLTYGTSFMVNILTPEGVNIASDFDQLNECPPVDSVFYTVKEIPTTDPKIFIKGIQFYLDLNAENVSSHYYRWEAEETFEYHMTWPIEWYYDGTVHHVFPPDYSRSVCWQTLLVNKIFTLSTASLDQNKYKALPLHFVNNYSSARLVYGYSLLVRQYALSEAAYSYWEKLRINSSDQGGLYEKQPLAIKGNIHNVSNPDQLVLGFFGASSISSKRIFVRNVENLPNEYSPGCKPTLLRNGLIELRPRDYPAYLYGNAEGYMLAVLDSECVDCLVVGGINKKPAFWPW